jgi:hypothetical protein
MSPFLRKTQQMRLVRPYIQRLLALARHFRPRLVGMPVVPRISAMLCRNACVTWLKPIAASKAF